MTKTSSPFGRVFLNSPSMPVPDEAAAPASDSAKTAATAKKPFFVMTSILEDCGFFSRLNACEGAPGL